MFLHVFIFFTLLCKQLPYYGYGFAHFLIKGNKFNKKNKTIKTIYKFIFMIYIYICTYLSGLVKINSEYI